MPDQNCDPVSSVWRTGPQPQSFEFSVACRTSTAGTTNHCGQLGPGTRLPLQRAVDVVHCWIRRDSVSSVWHAGPQLRSCEFSVACWTPTPILRVQSGVPDLNCGDDEPFRQIGLGTGCHCRVQWTWCMVRFKK